ncbi:hypothetical protein SOVF_126100 [Spinacia oleracea]|uniref:Nuclear transcription factor Y subunit B-5-like n=1 Tax=Spinacia oleracea TaxID=3562 RepID=A0A9R0ILA9_SPIOL|nr:nuclear transcription factor Y subunit B-5-like [Spinacia oleracea]KNA12418.1 hypothetical protein SOVF_126100 [Spinacia oleracea]
MPLVGNADGLDNRMANNIQSSMQNHFESKHDQTQINISNNKNHDLHTNHKTPKLGSKAPKAAFREQELYMPIANVVRIIRQGLPPNAKVADEAKEMVQECVSEFISFITSEANETCQLEHRKTITAEDVIRAMSRLGFDHYVEPLTIYLQKYRESEMLPPIPRHGVGNMGLESGNVLPPFAVVHPQFSMFKTSSENQGLYTATVCDGSGPRLGLGIGGESNDSEATDPSESPHAGQYFYNPYGYYRS